MAHQVATKKPVSRQLRKQLSVLGMVLFLTLAYFTWQAFNSRPDNTSTQTPQIETEFDTQTLDQVKDIETEYPELDPVDVGKEDPFSL